MASEKILRLAKALEDNLKLRGPVAGGAVTVTYTTPDVLTVNVAGTAKAIVKFTTFAATTPGGLDGIGLSQRVYSPHIAQVLFDADDTFAAGGDIQARIVYEVSRQGVKLEVYAHAAVDVANIVAANLKYSLEDVQYPLLATV